MEEALQARKTLSAVIVAAFPSRTTRRFRATLPMGEGPMVKKLAEAYQAAGVGQICVITGENAPAVEAALSGMEVTFLYDENHRRQDLLSSAKLGLSACLPHCDGVFVSPVCIPPFTAHHVQALKDSGETLCLPVSHGAGGHPILLSKEAATGLLAYRGEGGIKGGLASLGLNPARIPVEETASANQGKTSLPFSQQVLIRLTDGEPFFGPGPQRLLLAVRSQGSVLGACEAMGLSYSKGRQMIRRMEGALGFPLVHRIQGGSGGGSARLTREGELFLELYARYERAVADYASALFFDYFGELVKQKEDFPCD